MHYAAYIHREGKHWLAEFPDAPGCQTFADSAQALKAAAQEALEGWLAAHLTEGKSPPQPQPHSRAPRGRKLWHIAVSPSLAAPLCLRWARHALGLTQQQLAKRAGVAQQLIARLENPDTNPTLKSIERAAQALGFVLDISISPTRRATSA